MFTVVLTSIVIAQFSAAAAQKEAPDMMRDYLRAEMVTAFEKRSADLENLKTPEDCLARGQRMREFFLRQIGGMPEKTPLNDKVLGQIDKGSYTIEKVMYESRPAFYVTALFYLPKSNPPFPGVLVPCGHDLGGKSCEAYQRACVFLVTNGFAVLCYDPIGQGERVQLFDAQGKPKHGSTVEHTMVLVNSLPLGWGTATFRIWDGIRSIDYLCSRQEVDAKRIGCTGNSGGGTMTAFLMALDDRIVCAAPSCYITSLRNHILNDGPHDGEQNIPGQFAVGMDQGDFILMRAPKPTLVCCATHDFFPIAGTWDSFRTAKRVYTKLGYAERVDIAEADESHGFTPPLRQAMVRWMRRWLMDRLDPVIEGDFKVLTDAETHVTASGNVFDIKGARSVWDLDREYNDELASERRALWAKNGVAAMLPKIREVTNIRTLDNLPAPDVETGESSIGSGYTIAKVTFTPEKGIHLPGVLYEPAKPKGVSTLIASDTGVQSDAVRTKLESLAKKGHRVLAIDVRGLGATQSLWSFGKEWDEAVGPAYESVMVALMLGRPYLAMRAEDILACARWLKQRGSAGVALLADGEVGPAALHAAALEQDLFASVRIEGALRSWSDVVRTVEPKAQFVNEVHGALRVYDLPDLAKTIPTKKLTVVDSRDACGKP